jgi:hypothetical protein
VAVAAGVGEGVVVAMLVGLAGGFGELKGTAVALVVGALVKTVAFMRVGVGSEPLGTARGWQARRNAPIITKPVTSIRRILTKTPIMVRTT